MSPALAVQAVVLIVGGLAVYWSTIAEIRAALAESRTTTRYHEKEISDLERRLLDMDRRLQVHDETTRKIIPLGKRTDTFTPEHGVN